MDFVRQWVNAIYALDSDKPITLLRIYIDVDDVQAVVAPVGGGGGGGAGGEIAPL